MRKRNLLIFTLVVVLMTAMSAPVFAGSQGDRPEHKKTHTDKVYAAKKGSISVDTRIRIREDRAHVRVRVNQGAAKKTTLYTTVYLLKSSKGHWTTVARWSGRANGRTLNLTRKRKIVRGRYMVKSVSTVRSGRGSDTLVDYSKERSCRKR